VQLAQLLVWRGRLIQRLLQDLARLLRVVPRLGFEKMGFLKLGYLMQGYLMSCFL